MHIVLSYPIMSYNDVKIQLLTCAYHVIVRNYLKYILLFIQCMYGCFMKKPHTSMV